LRPPSGIRRVLFGAAALIIAIALWQGAGAQVNAPPPPEFPFPIGGGFTLTDQDGETRTDRDFRGRFLLVYFGYTRCPIICLDGLDAMAAALDLLREDSERVQPLFITVDPGRDRPEQIRAFVSKIHSRLIGLTGTEAQVRAVVKAYRISRRKVVLPDMPAGDYLVSHTPTTFLMGPDGEFVTLYPYGTEPEFMAASMLRHFSE
jgi:protein SCO1/2